MAAQHPEAVVLSNGSATVEGCLSAMDGAELVHVAAHGRFRADNPMFSALELDDGPLTVHDFERLRARRTGSCCRRATRACWSRWVPTSCSDWPRP